MDFGLSIGSMALLALALSGAGLATGFIAGLLGIGGGGILVPVLFEVFTWLGVDPAVRMHLTIGTGLAVIVPTSARSFMAHNARGTVDNALVRRLSPWIAAGVVIGVVSAASFKGVVLQVIWVVFTSVMVAKLVFGSAEWRLGNEIPTHKGPDLYAAVVGGISAIMSVGGAVYFILLMTLYGRTLHQAVATSAAFGLAIALPGAIGFVWAGWGASGMPPGTIGYVNLLGAALIIPASVLAAPWGARLTHRLKKRTLELALAGFLTVAILRLLISLLS